MKMQKNILTRVVRLCYTFYTKSNTSHYKSKFQNFYGGYMTLCEELFFEIKLSGKKSELKKFVSFLKSGELDDFFEITSEYIDYDDTYHDASDDQETSVSFVNEEYGIEIEEFDTDEFLDVFCKAGANLDIEGRLFDIDDEEYSFISAMGDTYYVNSKNAKRFNDELDEAAYKEEQEED